MKLDMQLQHEQDEEQARDLTEQEVTSQSRK